MSFPSISCSVVDRRTRRPVAGLSVILRCLQPDLDPAQPDDYTKRVLQNNEFKAETDSDGWILQQWRARDVPELTLLHFLWISNQVRGTTVWQMGFHTTEYFAPAEPRYIFVDANFVLHRGQDSPHISLCVDLDGYGACLEPYKEVQRRTQQARFSQKQQKAFMEPSPNESYPDQAAHKRPWAEHSKQRTLQVRRRKSQCPRETCHGKQSMLRYQTTDMSETNDMTSGRFDTLIVDAGNQTNPIIVDASIPADPIIVDAAVIVGSEQDDTIIVDTGVQTDMINVNHSIESGVVDAGAQTEMIDVGHSVEPGTSASVQADMTADTEHPWPAVNTAVGAADAEPKGLGLVLRRSARQTKIVMN